MSEPFLGYPGVENLRHVFSVHINKPGCRRFPKWSGVSFECEHSEPREFFLDIIEQAECILGIDRQTLLGQCEVAPGLAVFIEFSWCEKSLIQCSAQAVVVTNGTMTELLSAQPPRALYYRFDFSIGERGNLFDHPFPHAHSYFDGAPRFPFGNGNTSFPLFHWLEFLMLNHHYPLWLNWAKEQCNGSQVAGLRTAVRNSSDFFDDFPDEAKWNSIPSNERDAFVRAAKQTLHEATNSVAAAFPTIPKEFLNLNYWTQ